MNIVVSRIRLPKLPHFWLSFLVACALGPATYQPASGQSPLSPEAEQAEIKISEELKNAGNELREHLKKMHKERITYHMTETNTTDKRHRENWALMCDEGRVIFKRYFKVMQDEYKAGNAELRELIGAIFEQAASDDRFEGMLELSLQLQRNGYKSENLLERICITAIATNEFDIAEQTVRAGMQQGLPKFEMLPVYFQNLEKIRSTWQDELKAREEDAKGEPLPQVRMLTTKGEIVIELFENQAPETVANFISLVESGFYDGRKFHRVLEHFVAQAGCPLDDGSGGPGYTIHGEASKPNARKFFRGTLGMALSGGDVNSAGSQFFICQLPTFMLNDKFTAFGRVVSDMETVGCLQRVDPEKNGKDGAEKVDSNLIDMIISAKVIRKRDHEYVPHKFQ